MRKPDKQGDLARVIYLDYAATTPTDSRVMSVMQQELADVYGNASSLYSVGRTARSHVETARRQVASLLGASPSDIFFTSGGSESDNAALKGMAFARREKGMPCGIVTSAIEHPAVLRTCEWLEKQGFPVTYLPVDRAGRVSPDDLEAVLSAGFTARRETGIVSIMMANNEVGTIEPVRELAAIAHDHGAVFHTDAVQAAGHLPIDVGALGIDALSLSGHKLYGPKGIGVLYLRRGVVMDPLIHGGQQERGLRAGTENVPAIAGLGCAAEIAQKELAGEAGQLRRLKSILWDEISAIPGAFRNGPSEDDAAQSLAGTLNFGIRGIRRDTLLIRLDLAGFAVSAGSACSAGSLEPSHVLSAMGVSESRAQSSLRVSLGRFTTEKDIHAFAEELRRAVAAVQRA